MKRSGIRIVFGIALSLGIPLGLGAKTYTFHFPPEGHKEACEKNLDLKRKGLNVKAERHMKQYFAKHMPMFRNQYTIGYDEDKKFHTPRAYRLTIPAGWKPQGDYHHTFYGHFDAGYLNDYGRPVSITVQIERVTIPEQMLEKWEDDMYKYFKSSEEWVFSEITVVEKRPGGSWISFCYDHNNSNLVELTTGDELTLVSYKLQRLPNQTTSDDKTGSTGPNAGRGTDTDKSVDETADEKAETEEDGKEGNPEKMGEKQPKSEITNTSTNTLPPIDRKRQTSDSHTSRNNAESPRSSQNLMAALSQAVTVRDTEKTKSILADLEKTNDWNCDEMRRLSKDDRIVKNAADEVCTGSDFIDIILWQRSDRYDKIQEILRADPSAIRSMAMKFTIDLNGNGRSGSETIMPLNAAIMKQDLKMAKLLVEHGAEICENLYFLNPPSSCALFHAAQVGADDIHNFLKETYREQIRERGMRVYFGSDLNEKQKEQYCPDLVAGFNYKDGELKEKIKKETLRQCFLTKEFVYLYTRRE